MNATQPCPFPASWTSRQIADAVAPRLHEMDFGISHIAASGVARPGQRVVHDGYLPRPALSPRFRING